MKKYELKKAQVNCQKALETCNRCLIKKSIRSGKTLCMLDYIQKKNYKRILWVTSLADFRDYILPREMEDFGFNLNITCICYESLKNYTNTSWDIIIADECQKITKNYCNYLVTINANKSVYMTGTLKNTKSFEKIIYDILRLKLVFEYTVDDAVLDHNVSDYKISLIYHELSKEKTTFVKYSGGSFYTSDHASYTNLSIKYAKAEYDDKKKEMARLSIYMCKFLNKLTYKIEFAKQYIRESEKNGKRVLIFAEDSKTASLISSNTYNSKTDKSKLDDFNSKKINHLVLVNKGSVGQSYVDVDGCLLTVVNSSNDFIQQRAFRTILYRKNHVADIRILVSKNTRQERWIESALFDIDESKIIKHVIKS